MESGSGSMMRWSPLNETHSHSPLSKTTDNFSVPLRLIPGPDLGLNARFGFSIYSQCSCLFHPHPASCHGSSFRVFGTKIRGILSLYSGVSGDSDRHPGCLRMGQLCFRIPCCHLENKRCVDHIYYIIDPSSLIIIIQIFCSIILRRKKTNAVSSQDPINRWYVF